MILPACAHPANTLVTFTGYVMQLKILGTYIDIINLQSINNVDSDYRCDCGYNRVITAEPSAVIEIVTYSTSGSV
jgi:hypothetical protein